jgi:ribonuclease III
MDEKVLQQIEQKLGYEFSDRKLLSQALTHSSSVDQRALSNERLEFLGDSILGVTVCQSLFKRFPDYLEGDLTKIKSMLVSRITCAKIAKQLGLHKSLNVGKGMISSRALAGSLAAGVLEAVIGAIYIDGGFEMAEKFVLNNFMPLIELSDAEQSQGNFKSILQQYAQQNLGFTPVYQMLDEKGPDHDKCFEVEVVIKARHFSSAWGPNKKTAEQKAALNALIELEVGGYHPDENED